MAVLASEGSRRRARILAAFFRVLYLLSASTPGVLPMIGFAKTGPSEAEIRIPAELADLDGERPEERVRQLGSELGLDVRVIVGG